MSKLKRSEPIEVEMFDGTVYELRPTLRAFQRLQTRFGGLRGVIEALGQLNIESVSQIIAAGVSADRKQLQEIQEQVFETGVADVTEAVTPYVNVLLDPNGDAEQAQDEPEKKD